MKAAQKVLITGADGAIGKAAAKALRAAGHFVRGFDLRPSPEADESVTGSLTDAPLVESAARGMDVIIHLAATVDDAPFMEQLLPNNVVGLFNILEAARKANVKRISLASTMQVISGLKEKGGRIVRVEEGTSPLNHYAATKVFAESMGLLYHNKHGMEVICPRIGWLPRNPDDVRRLIRSGGENGYLSHHDAGRFYRQVVEADRIEPAGYAVVFLLSKRKRETGPDFEPARRAVGYEPHDYFPDGLGFKMD
jgi:nucleoside-diphosphate-sugar epimerase